MATVKLTNVKKIYGKDTVAVQDFNLDMSFMWIENESEDILRINELYYKHKTYAEVARQTGFSASTVKKYVIPGWAPVATENIIKFNIETLNVLVVVELFS